MSLLEIFFATFIVLGVVTLMMSVGVIFSNKRIKGSCGGLNALLGMDGSACDVCTEKDRCDKTKVRFKKDQEKNQ